MVLYRDLDFDGDNDILAGVQGLRSPLHVTLDPSKATADAEGRKSFDPGQWIAQSGNYGRILPRSKAAAAWTTASTSISVPNAAVYVPGDVLVILNADGTTDPVGTIDTGGVDVANGTLTLAATATTAGSEGDSVGTADEVLGLFLRALDLLEGSLEIGVYKSASVKLAALPYYDDLLKAQFPEIIAV